MASVLDSPQFTNHIFLPAFRAYNLHAKLYAEAAARPKNPAFQGPQTYNQQQPSQQYGAPQPQYQAPSPQYGAPQQQQPQYQAPQQQPQYQAPQQQPQQFQSTATSVQGYQSAPSNQYLPPTSRQQSFNPQSGYRYWDPPKQTSSKVQLSNQPAPPWPTSKRHKPNCKLSTQ